MNETDIKSFWEQNPCGTGQVADHAGNFAAFFDRYDAFRYRDEAHIPACLDRFDWAGRRVLEIGLGQGAESEQIVRRGGVWTGLDLTEESCGRVKARMQVRDLNATGVVCGSARQIPLPDDHFDYVFSHGVLHHIVEIGDTQAEIARVLKRDGRLVMMVYARHSLNYWIAIALLRRVALLLVCIFRLPVSGKTAQHVENVGKTGLVEYLRLENFVHRNTDGPLNPFARVYTKSRVENDFPAFDIVRIWKSHMHAPPLPVRWLRLSRWLGWHLWVELRPKA